MESTLEGAIIFAVPQGFNSCGDTPLPCSIYEFSGYRERRLITDTQQAILKKNDLRPYVCVAFVVAERFKVGKVLAAPLPD